MEKETRFYIHTLGCKVNSYESFALGEELKRRGYVETKNKEEADILILNTCSVTGKADAKVDNISPRCARAHLTPSCS